MQLCSHNHPEICFNDHLGHLRPGKCPLCEAMQAQKALEQIIAEKDQEILTYLTQMSELANEVEALRDPLIPAIKEANAV